MVYLTRRRMAGPASVQAVMVVPALLAEMAAPQAVVKSLEPGRS